MTRAQDLVSGIIHLFGVIFAVFALVILIIYSVLYGELAWDIVTFSVFGTALILLYLFSTLYHMLNLGETGTRVFRKFDHIMIYLFIAASYTPICLGPLRGPWGWTIFGIVWGIALLGTILTAVWIKAPRWLSTGIYIGMGWIVLIAIYPMVKTFTALNALNSLSWLVAGGIFYTIGGVIYGLKWPHFKNKYFGFHEIFHIFILLGSACHFWFFFNYLIYI